MRHFAYTLLLLIFIASAAPASAGKPWDLADPTVAQAAAGFQQPPPEYGLTLWWGWDGPVTPEVIRRDLDTIKGYGFASVMIEAGSGMTARYLSPEWFALVRVAVDEAARRDLRVWVEDEGKYPSGFAGGKISKERPDLRMQALLPGELIPAAAGQTVSLTLNTATLGAIAVNLESGARQPIPLAGSKLQWTAPAGRWEIRTAVWAFRTGQTAWIDNPSRARKDTAASLCDYLNPESARQIIAWTHDGYKKALGAHMGTTFMGLMGDEPSFSYIPWTPRMADEFQRRKGYDVRPWLPAIAARNNPDPQARRAKADYWDVWSDLFAENYFKVLADWAEASGVEYIVHMDKDDNNVDYVRGGGDYFKVMSHPQGPGIDVIWAQIWPDHTTDYPKMASSASHLFGRARAFTESFAAFTNPVDVPLAKWVMDCQLARGINQIQVMAMGASSRPRPTGKAPGTGGMRRGRFFADPAFPELARYASRLAYLLSMGRPTAQIAVLVPTTSLWLGDTAADASNLAAARTLLEGQRDFDWVGERSLGSGLALEGGAFVNRSGQAYRAVIVPAVSAISLAALERLHEFAARGGRVIFLGHAPSMAVGRSFLNAEAKAPEIGWATLEAGGQLSAATLAALPAPDVKLAAPAPAVLYQHRHFKDGEVYFFFNEKEAPVETRVTLAGTGTIEEWDAASGRILTVVGKKEEKGTLEVPLTLAAHGTRCFVVK